MFAILTCGTERLSLPRLGELLAPRFGGWRPLNQTDGHLGRRPHLALDGALGSTRLLLLRYV